MPRSADQRNRAKRAIKRAVTQDYLSQGGFLPSERTLAQQFGVSRSTMRLALQDLQHQGFVSHHGGHGWQVIEKTEQCNVLFIRHRNVHISNMIEQGLRQGLGPDIDFSSVEAAPNNPISEWDKHPPLSVYDPKIHNILIVFSEVGVPEAFEEFVRRNGGHIICMGCNLHEQYDTICADFAHMSRVLVRYIRERGHRSIAFVGSKHQHTKNPSFAARVIGYQTAMKMHDLEPETVLLSEGFETLYEDFARWLDNCEAKGNRPTCLYVSGPNYVLRLARILDKLGISIPGDMSMAGFGYSGQSEEFTQFDKYVTIVEPWVKIGLLAAQNVMSYSAQAQHYMPSLTLVPSRIVPGNSVRVLSSRYAAH